jgi:SAM-dependent methyltransferase
VGCGDGGLLAALDAPGRVLIGLDLHPEALGRTQPGTAVTLVQADAQRIPCADGSMDTVLALDVLDQQGVDLAVALSESHRVLAPGGVLLLRVSAHGWLYGPHDAAFNSGRRYGRTELLRALADAGFHVRRLTYANSLLAPLLILQRLLQRWRVLPWSPALYRAGWSNRLVAAALKTEARWLRRRNLGFGLSLVVIAEKKERRKLKIED